MSSELYRCNDREEVNFRPRQSQRSSFSSFLPESGLSLPTRKTIRRKSSKSHNIISSRGGVRTCRTASTLPPWEDDTQSSSSSSSPSLHFHSSSSFSDVFSNWVRGADPAPQSQHWLDFHERFRSERRQSPLGQRYYR